MIVYKGLQDKNLKYKKRSIAIGIFDGVHLGHQKIVKKLISDSVGRRISPLIITFEPHPTKILNPSKDLPILMSLPHRLKFFQKMGVREAIVIRFNKKIASIAREEFLSKILLKHLGMRSLIVGHDFCFGRGGLGNDLYLRERSKALGFDLSVVGPLRNGEKIISSTRIRKLIDAGDLKTAGRMLGRPVSVYGNVVRGHGRGRKMGFPTANLNLHHETLPPSGVYAIRGVLSGRPLKGVVHIGARPTFGEQDRSVEAHFFNFHKDIYGREVELFFVRKLRNIRRFQDKKSLVLAIRKDITKALEAFK